MYQCSKKLVKYKEYSCFDHSDFPAHSVFASDVCWGSLGTSIFGNSSSAANITRSRLPSRLSFHFLWLWYQSRLELESIHFCEDTCDKFARVMFVKKLINFNQQNNVTKINISNLRGFLLLLLFLFLQW